MNERGANVMDLPARPGGSAGLAGGARLCIASLRGGDEAPSARERAAFHEAYGADDPAARDAIHAAVADDPVLCDRLLLQVLPRLASGLGADWCAGTASFVDVTILCAHVHESLRVLGRVARPVPDAACVIVAIPRGEDHALPAALLCYRLRRMGLHARMMTDASAGAVARLCRDTAAEALLIGASTDRGFARACDVVRALRRVGPLLPIALGGSALRHHVDAARTCGADVLSDDPVDALERLGVPVPAQAGEGAA